MSRKKTNQEFTAEIKALVGDEYVFLEEYQGNQTNILCRHNKCGNEWLIRPGNFLQGKRCPACKERKPKYTLEKAKKIFAKKGLKLLAEKYESATTNMPFVCSKHPEKGIQYRSLSAINNTNTPGCKYCGYEQSKEKQIDKSLYEEMNQVFANNQLQLIDTEYRGVKEWYHCKCLNNPSHGVVLKRYTDVKHLNQGCPKCGYEKLIEARRKPISYYKDIVESNGYIFKEIKYNHRNEGCTEIYFTCPKHSQHGIQMKTVGKIKEQGCFYCSESKGEAKIRQALTSRNIKYISQKWFKDLRGIGDNPLSYDFYLLEYNILIEFQGIQHEKPIDIFGGEKQFQIQQEHDKRKRDYAENNNYKLLEIWHYEIDCIDEIIDKAVS